MYELPLTHEVVRFLHAALGFPMKAALPVAIRKGNLVLGAFPGMNMENVARFVPDSNETQKGHMRQTCQGVRSMKKTKDVDEQMLVQSNQVKRKEKCTYGFSMQQNDQCTPG